MVYTHSKNRLYFLSQHGFGLPFMPGMEHMKTAGAHLNPAFLHDMTQGGSGDASKSAPQNMVSFHTAYRIAGNFRGSKYSFSQFVVNISVGLHCM